MQSSLGGFDLFMKGLIVLSGDLPARLLHSVGVNIFQEQIKPALYECSLVVKTVRSHNRLLLIKFVKIPL